MRVLGLMVLLALTGSQSAPPLDTAQCQASGVDNPASSHCAYKREMVEARGTRQVGGQLP